MSVTSAQLAAYNNLGNGSGILYLTDSTGALNFLEGKGLGIPNDAKGARIARSYVNNLEYGTTTRSVRVFLDTAATDVAIVSGQEITEFVSPRGLESVPSVQDVVVASNTVSFVRDASIMLVRIDGDTTAGNANRVDTFTVTGAEAGDRVTLSGIDGAVSPILTTGAFNYLEYEIALVGYATTVTFMYSPTGVWNQITPNKTDTDSLREQGIPVPAQPGVYKLTPSGGTQTIYPGAKGTSGAGSIYEPDVVLVGAGVTLAASLEFVIDITDALESDSGTIMGNGTPITLSGNSVSFVFNGVTKTTLPEEVALSGRWAVSWIVTGLAVSQDVSFTVTPDFGATNTEIINTDMIKDGAVTNAKIASGIDGAKLSAGTVSEAALSAAVALKLNALAWIYLNVVGNHNAADRQSVNIDATAANRTVFLPEPSAASPIQIIRVRKVDSGANTVTIDALSNTIDGAGTYVLSAQYENVEVEWNGTEWFINS